GRRWESDLFRSAYAYGGRRREVRLQMLASRRRRPLVREESQPQRMPAPGLVLRDERIELMCREGLEARHHVQVDRPFRNHELDREPPRLLGVVELGFGERTHGLRGIHVEA